MAHAPSLYHETPRRYALVNAITNFAPGATRCYPTTPRPKKANTIPHNTRSTETALNLHTHC